MIRSQKSWVVEMPNRPHICHIYHIFNMWRKNFHVENFQLSMYDDCREIKKFSTCGEISDVFPWQMWKKSEILTIKFSAIIIQKRTSKATFKKIAKQILFSEGWNQRWLPLSSSSVSSVSLWQSWSRFQLWVQNLSAATSVIPARTRIAGTRISG